MSMILINPLPQSDIYLYHYTTAETALNHILKDGTLRLGSYLDVNDPRENKHWDISTLVRADSNLSLDQYHRLSLEVSELLKANAKVICFSRDGDEAVREWQPKALLHRGFAKPSMWHHYGDKSRGICLTFNRQNLQSAFSDSLKGKLLIADRVRYSNSGIIPHLNSSPFSINLLAGHDRGHVLRSVKGHFAQYLNELFFTKLSDWEHEAEYRWVCWDDNPAPVCVGFADALEAVIVGDRFDMQFYESVQRYCVKYRAELATLSWHNGYPKVKHSEQPHITQSHLYPEAGV